MSEVKCIFNVLASFDGLDASHEFFLGHNWFLDHLKVLAHVVLLLHANYCREYSLARDGPQHLQVTGT